MLSHITIPTTPIEYASERISRATLLAYLASFGQTRKDGCTPEYLHPLAVQRLLAVVGIEDDVIHAAGLLHDSLENNAGERANVLRGQIANSLGTEVLDMVELLTDDTAPDVPRITRKARQMERLAQAPWEVQVIKLADVVASVQEGPAPGWSSAYAQAYVQQRSLLVSEVLQRSCAELAFYFKHALTHPKWQRVGVSPR